MKIIQAITDNYIDTDENLIKLIKTYMLAGRFHDAQKLVRKLNQRNFNEKSQYAGFINNTVDFIGENSITNSEFESLMDIAMSTLHQHDIYVPSERIEMFLSDEDGGSVYFDYWIKVNKPVDEVVDLNFELADRIIDECSDKIINSHIVPMYIATAE